MPNARSARAGSSTRRQRVALRVQRQQRAVADLRIGGGRGCAGARERGQPSHARDRHRVVQAGGAAQRIGMPGVVAAGGEHAGDVRGRGHAYAGPHVAEIARVLEQDRGQLAAVDSTAAGSTAGRSASAITPVAGASGASCAKTAGSTGAPRAAGARPDRVRAGGEAVELGGVAAGDLEPARRSAGRA